MLVHPHPPAVRPPHQLSIPAEYAYLQQQHELPPSAMPSSSRRSDNAFQRVNEVIDGKVQEIYVIDDDTPPPLNPLSVQSARDPHLVNNYSYANGHTGYNAAQPVYQNGSSVIKGKRKADDSTRVGNMDDRISMLAHDADLIAAGPDGALAVPNNGMALQKRRKRSHALNGADPLAPTDIASLPSSAGVTIPAKCSLDLTQAKVQPNYRGGYPAGAGTLDDIARYNQSAVQSRQGYEGTANTRDSYASIPASTLPTSDKEGHFIPREGEYVSSRYKIIRLLGQGTFGKVVECIDKKTNKYVAIKIIRAVQKYRDASQIEIRVLRTLRENDPHNENRCIHLLDTFNFKNHVCIVSELLGKSVFDFLKENGFKPFPPVHIWQFAKQLLQSVAFLHRLNLVHTDLKPENILLVNNDYSVVATSRRANAKRKHVLNSTEIRLIDFGSATFNEEFHSSVVSTRHYRAPEIILEMGWSFPCDVWSVGCILVEFFTGEALFQTHDNLEHLAMMEAVLGSMPDDYRRKAETYKPQLFKGGALNYPNSTTPKSSRKYVRQMVKLQDIVASPSNPSAYAKHNTRFLHLLRRLLDFDPTKRIRVADALKHPYFELDPERDFPPN